MDFPGCTEKETSLRATSAEGDADILDLQERLPPSVCAPAGAACGGCAFFPSTSDTSA